MMPRTFKGWLRLWFLLLALTPLVAAGLVAYQSGASALRNHVGAELTALAIDALDKIDRTLFERYGDAQAFAGSEAAHARDPQRLTPFMDRMVGMYAPMYGLTVMTDRQGKVRAVNSIGPTGERLDQQSLIGKDVSGEPWFQQAITGHVNDNQTLVSFLPEDADALDRSSRHGRSLSFAAPVRDATGTIVGVWANRVEWSVVEAILKDIPRRALEQNGHHLRVTLVNQDGTVLVSSWDAQSMPRQVRTHPLVQSALESAAGASGFLQGQGLDGDHAVLAGYARERGYANYQGLGWSLVIEQDRDEALADVSRLAHVALILTLIVGLMGCIAGGWAAGALTGPLRALTRATQAIGSGHSLVTAAPPVRVAVPPEQELAEIASAFNAMAERLESQTGARKTSAQALADVIRDLLSADPNKALCHEVLSRWLAVLTGLAQARYGAIGLVNEAGELTDFLHTGLSQEEADRIGSLPTGRGLLGALLQDRATVRMADLTQDPRCCGFPPGHPPMRSFLGVPIAGQQTVYGRLYLAEKSDPKSSPPATPCSASSTPMSWR
ncbi:MAG: HAMP domain-containing protein [Nitrospira sp.]|nr:MAG: HAMP domain-containing protein [Nitrospira sp.]